MRVAFKPLFRVRMRHAFFTQGTSGDAFKVEPTPASRRALGRYGLVHRPLADGLVVYAEIRPGSSPQELLRPLGDGTLRLSFLVHSLNRHLWNISNLPEYQPGKSAFYFNNLRDDQTAGRLHLGDSAAGVRVGEALPLVSGESYTHRFAAAVNSATLTIEDLFGSTIHTTSFAHPNAATAREHRLDLTRVDKLVPGSHTVKDDHGGSQRFYYDPELFADRPFGIVEVFNRTDALTPDESDLVPADYRFLDANQLAGVKDYHVQLEQRSTTWHYVVVKKSAADGIALDSLAVKGEIAFTKVPSSDPLVFASDSPAPLREKRADLTLVEEGEEDDERLLDLPSPTAGTPLQSGSSPEVSSPSSTSMSNGRS